MKEAATVAKIVLRELQQPADIDAVISLAVHVHVRPTEGYLSKIPSSKKSDIIADVLLAVWHKLCLRQMLGCITRLTSAKHLRDRSM